MKFDRIMIIDDDVEFLEEPGNYFAFEGCEVVALTGGMNAESEGSFRDAWGKNRREA